MKLSKAQQKVMDEAIKDINEARTMDFESWFRKKIDWCQPQARESYRDAYMAHWNNRKNGIVLTHCNSKTLVKLEELGFIEIIEDFIQKAPASAGAFCMPGNGI